MIARLKLWVHAWLVALDQLAYVSIFGWAYLLGFGRVPSPYETISSRCGRAANAGSRWGFVAERWIDRLFEHLGSAPGHCQRSIIRADWLTAPLP